MTSNRRIDWHREDIKAELAKRGLSLAELGRQNGLSSRTVKNALDKPYSTGERLIANALGVNPEDIWPSRYNKNEFSQLRSCV